MYTKVQIRKHIYIYIYAIYKSANQKAHWGVLCHHALMHTKCNHLIYYAAYFSSCLNGQCQERDQRIPLGVIDRQLWSNGKDVASSLEVYPHVSRLCPLDVAGTAQIDGAEFQELLNCPFAKAGVVQCGSKNMNQRENFEVFN